MESYQLKTFSNYTEVEKLKLVRKEMNRLKKIYKGISKDKFNTVQSLIRNAAFMAITLDDLQMTINREGVISEYQNGLNQWGTKKSPEVEVYNTMIKNHSAMIKQLTDMLPDKEVADQDDGFEGFVNGRDDP